MSMHPSPSSFPGDALARGAKAHTGAKHDGQIYYPTTLTDVPLDAAIANEETFGPVVVVEVVDTPEEAIVSANRTMYGLRSSILAGNTYKAFEMAPKVLAGIVNVNSPTVNDEIHAPMGGVRDSGWVRTGPRSLDDCSDLIWIHSHSAKRHYPFRYQSGHWRHQSSGVRRLDIEQRIA
jgi:acyl-CoA reductase-like NAD-dependent aldehyde dehydrogenase